MNVPPYPGGFAAPPGHPGHPGQPGYQEWQAPPPPGNAPKRRPKWLIPVPELAGFLNIRGGIFAGTELFGDSNSGGSASAAAAQTQHRQSSTPTEALLAATAVTMNGTVVGSQTLNGATVGISQIDSDRRLSYTKVSGGPTAGSEVCFDENEMLFRFGSKMGLPGIDGDTWYRVNSDHPLFVVLIQAMILATDKDKASEAMVIYSSIDDKGQTDFDGQSLTRLVATVDSAKFVEYTMGLMQEFGGDVFGVTDTELREQFRAQVPQTVEFWIDDNGRIIKQVTDGVVVVNSKFCEALSIPTISRSEIEDLPLD